MPDPRVNYLTLAVVEHHAYTLSRETEGRAEGSGARDYQAVTLTKEKRMHFR